MGKITPRRTARAGGFGLVLIASVMVASGLSFAWDQTQPSPAEAAAAPAPAAVQLRPVDGGADYFAKYPNSLPTDPSYFPIGVWLESLIEPTDAPRGPAHGHESLR